MNISVVVPVYNSSGTLETLVDQLTPILQGICDHYELVLINDGSRDNSWELIERLAQKNPWIRGIDMMRNYGQHNALLCGIRAAQFEVIVTVDDDLQNPPSEIPKLLEKLEQGYDVVYGYPLHLQHGFYRNMASTVTKWVLKNAMGAETATRISPFRAFRTRLRDAFVNYQSPSVTIDVLLTWATSKFAAVDVMHAPRTTGQSNYNFMRLVAHAFNLITGFSTFPLQLASCFGFACMIFGFFVMVYVLVRYVINGGSVPGFPFLACLLSIFSGTQLFAIGIIGEYLARMHGRSLEKPSYAIRTSTLPLFVAETDLANATAQASTAGNNVYVAPVGYTSSGAATGSHSTF